MKLVLIVAIGLALLFCGFSAISAKASPTTLVVTKTADTADGACDADCSLREAISVAENGETIVFSALFNAPQTITLTAGQISIDKNLTIAGAGVGLLTVSGNNASRIFFIAGNRTVALSGMKLTGGRIAATNDYSGGAIYLTDSTLILTNVTLSENTARFTSTNPFANFGYGGAIYSYNSTLSIANSTINNNTAPSVGGIFSQLGIVNITNSMVNNNSGGGVVGFERDSISVSNSTFNGNSRGAVAGSLGRITVINSIITNNGSGISNESGGVLTIDRSTINNNEITDFANGTGGGVFNKGTATISNTVINNNRVSGIGGGIFNTGTMSIAGCAVTKNTAYQSGGGIHNAGGQLFLTNSTVSGNVADFGVGNSPGGGIYNTFIGNLILTNVTIAFNRATGNGGGLRHDSSGTVTMRNTIIAGNLATGNVVDVSGIVASQGFNLIGNTTGSTGWTSADLLNSNPLLAPLGNNGGDTLTHALLPGSPAINAGSNALARDPVTNLVLNRDQRNLARFIGGVTGGGEIDIGAYEANYATFPVTLAGRVLTASGRGVYNARITLTDANGATLYAQTNPFGYYRFVNLPPGTTYTINVTDRRRRFNSPQVVTVDQNRSDLNFIATL